MFLGASGSMAGGTTLTFPSGSPHCQHEVEMKPVNALFRRSEQFVLDSALYVWRMDSRWHSRRIGLYVTVGGNEVEVARFRQTGTFQTGGVLVVDPARIDPVIAATTCCVMLRKIRQRQAERSSSGGGGGGGG